MLYIGIDPGALGACAFLFEDDATWDTRVDVVDTPFIVVKSGKRNKKKLVPQAMAEAIRQRLPEDGKAFAVVELVGTMPDQGIASAFDFGTGWGMWQGILAALKVPFELVHPTRWKKAVLPDVDRSSKSASRMVAIRLFPEAHTHFARVKDDGRAEALLLAEYGRRTYGSGRSRQQQADPQLAFPAVVGT